MAAFCCLGNLCATERSPVSLPAPGDAELLILTPELLQLRLITGGKEWSEATSPFTKQLNRWGEPALLPMDSWKILSQPGPESPHQIVRQGLWRMPVYAGYKRFDLLLEWRIFLQVAPPLEIDAAVELRNSKLFPRDFTLRTAFSSKRINPIFHVSDFGFAPQNPKFGFISYNLGTLGELDLPVLGNVNLVNEQGNTVFTVEPVLRSSPDWEFDQHVWKIDFSELQKPGNYRMEVPGLGRSNQFRIDQDALLVAPRLLAGALYMQRSGWKKSPPFTRYGHEASHTAPAEVPNSSEDFRATNKHLADMAKKNTDLEKQIAPTLQTVGDALYPFVRKGPIDVSGGHYDAGDYSKYTINSAQLIHYLAFATDYFPGVSNVDNLGIPESGDGLPDALQIALHEARFLLKMQDEDGGFYFLVYPRNRPYELDVLPDQGDPQVVFPKTTAATAAAVGALAQLAASPSLQQADPEFAARCRNAALRGNDFLSRAKEKFGFAGSYQTISHYGNFAGHQDEWAFALAALFSLTGEKVFEEELMKVWADPTSSSTKRWDWWGLPESFGAAARIYAFCHPPENSRDPAYFAKIKEVLRETAETWLSLSDADAYGVPFSRAAKRQKRAGWFWVMEPAMDVACAWLLDPRPDFIEHAQNALALWAGFEAGGNPLNQPFFTGVGRHWRRNAVNRISLNDDRKLAVPGIPIGNIISTPHNLRPYQIEGKAGLRTLFTPSLETFPFYERSGTDAYNVREEWTIATGARLLAGHLFRLGQVTSCAESKTVVPELHISMHPARPKVGDILTFSVADTADRIIQECLVVWELIGFEPQTGASAQFPLQKTGSHRIEVEILWPDGLRAAAVKSFEVE